MPVPMRWISPVFVWPTGARISVLKDWPKQNQDAQFLRQVRDGACEAFSVVLSPDYNAAHRNHFHVDVGRWSVCR